MFLSHRRKPACDFNQLAGYIDEFAQFCKTDSSIPERRSRAKFQQLPTQNSANVPDRVLLDRLEFGGGTI